MKISARSDYAVRACLELARAGDRHSPVKSDAISQLQDIPGKFLENILLDLRRSGIVGSQRGADGGYWLARGADDITVADVIRAVDGPLAHVRGERPDAVHSVGAAEHLPSLWIALRAAIRDVLEDTTLENLVTGQLPERVTSLVDNPEAWLPH